MKVAIITARGGSKRIPKKNIKDFLGKPIIAYSIESALNSQLFDEVMVSTDNVEIAAIAQKFGATVPFIRSEKNADDFATTLDVLLEVIEQYETNGQSIDCGCCIYPTAPFISVDLLQRGHYKMLSEELDTVFPVLPFPAPIQRALKIEENKKVSMFQPEHLTSRSQDLESAYFDAGQFYFFQTQALKEKAKLWTDNSGVIVLSEMDAQDIDVPADWEIAEFKYRIREKNYV